MKRTTPARFALVSLILANAATFLLKAQETDKTPSESKRPTRVRISQKASQANLIHMVKPDYPKAAKKKGIEGDVVMKALLTKEGVVDTVDVLRGDPILAEAAVKAVKQWRFRPYLLNGDPVEVETQLTVRFALSPP
jgi:protein TonB